MSKKAKYDVYNRELSWVQFNSRVLEEAANPDNPLLEKGKFISICSSNLDEFFMVRVGSLMRALDSGSEKTDASGMTAKEQLAAIFPVVREQVARQYDLFLNEYIPSLKQEGVFLLSAKEISNQQKEWLSSYFNEQIMPLLTPRAIDDKRPFPLLAARCLHISMLLPPAERNGALRMALVPMPTSLPRIIMLPMGKGEARGILMEEAIALFAHRLFSGVQPVAILPFRITRNTDFVYNDSDADALIMEMRKNLKRRKWGKIVRMEVPQGGDNRLLVRLKKYLDVQDESVFALPGPLNLDFCMKQLASLPGFDHLRFPPFTPRQEPRFKEEGSIFRAIRKGDILLNHPYDSFDPVVRFICEAAEDPNVMAIKQTLYRVSGKSPIVAALSRAAQQGKQVTVLIEVRARFDEENNINWCLALEKAGCHVFYGVPKLKTHSKITLVVRREPQGLQRYVHLGTGNYNDVTAKLYTDFGLLTCDETIGRDAGAFFNTVTGYGETAPMAKLIAAPTHLRKTIKHLIQRETRNAENGLPARIIAKMNSLVDPKIIRHLTKAADAGVEIDLIVRGICCLKTGGRENLRVRSIVGRFLEHSRAFVFENAGEREVYLSSADWMPRNLDKRVELMFPVEDPDLQERIIASLNDELKDNLKAWEMKKSGKYRRVRREGELISSQETRILGPALPQGAEDEE
ncbi:MAG: polyphosphate kinase 1 [Clostridia bacterium]|nr:polyphosphate kinase 1 [Clostridia bacterium]